MGTTPRAEGFGAVLGHRVTETNVVVLAALSNYGAAPGEASAVEAAPVSAAGTQRLALPLPECPGALALGDLEGDGNLDLFVAGRASPGRYPEPVSSHLYRVSWTSSGAPQLTGWDDEHNRPLARVGMVSGAVFTDLTGDGYPELVLACEWGPVRIFQNQRGRLAPGNPLLVWPPSATVPAPRRPGTLEELTGWWNGVTSGDLDGDGRLDLVVTGWGRNTRFERFLSQPLHLYWGDLGGAGGVDVVETVFEPEMKRWVVWRDYDTMTRALPFLVEAAPTFKAYGEAGIDELFGTRLRSVHPLEAATLETLALLNRGDRFEVRPLPIEAQFAPAFGVSVADADGDGAEDVFLSQNFFGVEPETSRYDAGLGLWLRGNGQGGFTAVPAKESGVRIHGEQRGCAVGDFDRDGRLDLAVTQHHGPTRLYRNTRAQPGLRIRLVGPAGNPDGVGAVLRLNRGTQWGPAREVHAGSGYWSQDSAVQVLSLSAGPRRLEVRWPGGKTSVTDLPAAREVEIRPNGQARVVR